MRVGNVPRSLSDPWAFMEDRRLCSHYDCVRRYEDDKSCSAVCSGISQANHVLANLRCVIVNVEEVRAGRGGRTVSDELTSSSAQCMAIYDRGHALNGSS